MGILANLLGSGEVIKSVAETIDSIHTSDEEEIKAKAAAKTKLIEAYQPYRVAQRYLALMFTFTFLPCFVLVLAMTLTGRGDTEEVVGVLNQFWIGEIMFAIVTFYFGGGFKESWDRGK